jgi:hypothetical protein
MGIDFTSAQETCMRRAEQFINANESEKLWFIGGEIVDSAIVMGAWDDNIRKVCEWVVINGLGAQPDAAKYLLERWG